MCTHTFQIVLSNKILRYTELLYDDDDDDDDDEDDDDDDDDDDYLAYVVNFWGRRHFSVRVYVFFNCMQEKYLYTK